MISELSKSERETLKAIYRHTKDGDDAHTGALADTLGVTPGTVTASIKRLADRGLVDHRPYHGVTFTDLGRSVAVDAIRRHRLVERLLADLLGYSWQDADRLAPSFEHELPDEVEHRIYAVLGSPATCPHGFPIPAPEQHSIPDMPPLCELEIGDTAEVALPSSTDPEVVRFLDGIGVRPGVSIEVLEKHPFDGPVVVRVGGKDHTLGERIAQHIYVRKTGMRDDDQPVVTRNGGGRTTAKSPGSARASHIAKEGSKR